MKQLVLITGTARSGIGLVGAAFHVCGARGGKIVKVPTYDGRGSFENAEIRNALVSEGELACRLNKVEN